MPASITIRRRVNWIDTDAAGIWHHSTVIRWTEDAEAELHRRLGIIEQTFGATPRVHVGYDFVAPLRFDDEVDIVLTVARVGDTSLEYQIVVLSDGEPAVTGQMVVVFTDRASGKRMTWPPHLRSLLQGDDELS